MALRLCFLSVIGVAMGMNIVNRESKMCLDLRVPCIDDSDDPDCERKAPESLKQGTNLQLYKCNGKKNQEFELLSKGRLHNPLTGMCLDIMAPCKDHLRTPCERVPVSELKKEANIQLYSCHRDDLTVLSNSYGNQKWSFQSGQLRNWLSNLCLEPMLDAEGKMVVEANIHADTCKGTPYQKFDFVDAAMSTSEMFAMQQVEEKLEALPSGEFLTGSGDGQFRMLACIACASLVVATVAAKVARTWQRAPGRTALVGVE